MEPKSKYLKIQKINSIQGLRKGRKGLSSWTDAPQQKPGSALMLGILERYTPTCKSSWFLRRPLSDMRRIGGGRARHPPRVTSPAAVSPGRFVHGATAGGGLSQPEAQRGSQPGVLGRRQSSRSLGGPERPSACFFLPSNLKGGRWGEKRAGGKRIRIFQMNWA